MDAPPLRRAALVLNERAGTLLARPDLPEALEAALREAGFALSVIAPAPDMQARLDAALESGAETIIIGGGDGSIRSAAARLAGSERVLGILPLGTMNLLARDLGLPLDPLEAARALGAARPVAIDAGYVNDEIFLCQSVIGLPNTIGRHRERLRGRGLRALGGMAFAFWRALWRHRPRRLALHLPGRRRPLRVWARALSVVNGAYADAPGRMFHRPRLDGGRLVLYRPRRFGLAWLLRMLPAMALGRWRAQRAVQELHLRRFSIGLRRAHVTVKNDGEALLLAQPLRYRIAPRALRVLRDGSGMPAGEGPQGISRPSNVSGGGGGGTDTAGVRGPSLAP